jgi:F420-0:gamma-glutamyl ligase-like protein
MKSRLGINIQDRDLSRLRHLNETNVTKQLTTKAPVPNVYSSPIPDKRDQILMEMRKELDKKLEINELPQRN